VKQAAEFGLTRKGVRLASLLMFLTEVRSLGLRTAQGLVCTESFYWDLDDRTRAFTRRARALPRPRPGAGERRDRQHPRGDLRGDAALPEGRGATLLHG
jgi:hypothetical protein